MGWQDPLLKNSSRYTYETEKDFNQLRKKIRAIEQDLSVSSTTKLISSITFVKVNIDKEGPFSNNNSQPLIKSQRLLRLHLAPTKRQTIVLIL